MQVGILGPLVVENAGQPILIGGARLRSLFTRLAADGGRWVSSASLASALWPDEEPNGAPADQANALQSLVSRLRRALPDPQLIDSGPAGYRLVLAPEDLDATRFEQAVAAARRELRAGRTADGAAGLRAALGIWRGAALDDVPHLPYATGWASRLEELRLSATEDRIEAELQLGQQTLRDDSAALVPELEGLALSHPLRERLHGQLIRALYRSGRQAEALAAYERLRRTLADELGVDPSPPLKALHLTVLRGDEEASAPAVPAAAAVDEPGPPAKPQGPRRTNLRPALTSFVGRESDLDAVTQALHRSRLVTLVGAGGSGKTRLSLEAGRRLDGLGQDGIWQVELAPISDPENLAGAALSAIGSWDSALMEARAAAAGRRDDLTRLLEAIDERDIVILLDNCEHVIDAAAKLAEHLLIQCPQLRILATSREPLGIIGESVWPVQPLRTPDGGSGLAQMEAAPSVRLFVDRGSLVRPGFVLDRDNAAAVAEICRRLDGLPLAIELAAARLRTMTPQSIADRLQDRFHLLTGGSRTAMPRHQTLRAVVAWSWDLLTESERALTERLSLFPGGASVTGAAAIAVQSPDPDDEGEVLDRLISLADKSLLVPMDLQPPRYRMLKTIREFSMERLAARGNLASIRALYIAHYVELAEWAEPRLRHQEQLETMHLLNDERENLLGAVRFAIDAKDADSAIRISASLAWYWTLLGHHEEAASVIGQALAVPGESSPEPYLIALVTWTMNAAATGHGMPTDEDLSRMLELAEDLDPLNSHPLVAIIKPAMGILADDHAAVADAIERMRNHRDPWTLAMLHMLDALSAENAGELDRLRIALPQALEGFRALGDRWGTATALGTTADLLALDGDVAGSVAALDESRVLMAELRATDDAAYAQVRMGLLLLQRGDTEQARAHIMQAVDIAEEAGGLPGVAFSYLGVGLLRLSEGDRVAAREWANRALARAEASTMGPPQVLAMALVSLAHLDVLDGDPVAARGRFTAVWEAVLSSRDMPVAGKAMGVLAEVVSASGDDELAARIIGASEQVRGGPDLGDPELRKLVGRLRSALGSERFDELVTAGRTLSRADALALPSNWLGIDATSVPTAIEMLRGAGRGRSEEPTD